MFVMVMIFVEKLEKVENPLIDTRLKNRSTRMNLNRLKMNKLGKIDEIINIFFLVLQLWKAKIEVETKNQNSLSRNMSELKVDQYEVLKI